MFSIDDPEKSPWDSIGFGTEYAFIQSVGTKLAQETCLGLKRNE